MRPRACPKCTPVPPSRQAQGTCTFTQFHCSTLDAQHALTYTEVVLDRRSSRPLTPVRWSRHKERLPACPHGAIAASPACAQVTHWLETYTRTSTHTSSADDLNRAQPDKPAECADQRRPPRFASLCIPSTLPPRLSPRLSPRPAAALSPPQSSPRKNRALRWFVVARQRWTVCQHFPRVAVACLSARKGGCLPAHMCHHRLPPLHHPRVKRLTAPPHRPHHTQRPGYLKRYQQSCTSASGASSHHAT